MNKKTIFLLLAFASLIAVGSHLLFKPIQDTTQTKYVQEVQDLENNLATLKTTHYSDLKKLQNRNSYLVASLQSSKSAIQKANKQVKQLQVKVHSLAIIPLQKDTSAYIANCNELQDNVNSLLLTNTFKDSLVIEQAMQYEQVIEAKDSIINCFETDYSVLQQTTDTLLVLNENLLKANAKLKRSLVRRKNKSRILTGGVLLLAGLVTATQLRSIN